LASKLENLETIIVPVIILVHENITGRNLVTLTSAWNDCRWPEWFFYNAQYTQPQFATVSRNKSKYKTAP